MISQVISDDPIMSMVQLDYVLIYLTAVLLDCCRSTDSPPTQLLESLASARRKTKKMKTINSILYIIGDELLKDGNYFN